MLHVEHRPTDDLPTAATAPPRVCVKLETLCERLHTGELAALTQSSAWAGRAVEPHTCAVCGTRIVRGEIEYEPRALASYTAVAFTHLACFNLWLAASGLG